MSQASPKTVNLKEEPAAPAPSAPALPEFVKNIPDKADVFVLVPTDRIERDAVLAQLDDAVLKYFENPPQVHHELKAARLPYGAHILVAHCTVARAKREDGTFGPVKTLHIGGPIDLKKHTARSADGYTWDTSLGSVVDAVTSVCKHTKERVWLGMLSGDPTAEQRVLKLVAS